MTISDELQSSTLAITNVANFDDRDIKSQFNLLMSLDPLSDAVEGPPQLVRVHYLADASSSQR